MEVKNYLPDFPLNSFECHSHMCLGLHSPSAFSMSSFSSTSFIRFLSLGFETNHFFLRSRIWLLCQLSPAMTWWLPFPDATWGATTAQVPWPQPWGAPWRERLWGKLYNIWQVDPSTQIKLKTTPFSVVTLTPFTTCGTKWTSSSSLTSSATFARWSLPSLALNSSLFSDVDIPRLVVDHRYLGHVRVPRILARAPASQLLRVLVRRELLQTYPNSHS